MARAQALWKLLAMLAFLGHSWGVELEGISRNGMEASSAKQVPLQRALRGRAGEATTADVESSLVSELAGNVSKQRLQKLEEALRPMYASLPKEKSGYLGHQAVRYALHRVLLQHHGWFIVGLEPSDEALPPYLHGEWVPQYLQGLLEQRLGDRGIDLHEIAALAAALEDLVHAESAKRMAIIYESLQVSAAARVDSMEADRILETYMMIYLEEGDLLVEGKNVDAERAVFKQTYDDWDSAASWMQQIKSTHLSSTVDGKLGIADMVSIADDLGERFGAFNDGECKSLKNELLGLEGPRPGRVPLLDFYKKGLYSHWQFNEKKEYLRVLGALDESDELHPSVILPNYLGSRPNCLMASGLYAVCCRNECEDLMGRLEYELAAPTASPEQIQSLVAGLPSDTAKAPWELPGGLVQRLQDIAARHDGKVPLHGRLFAQWMHHAYPRECPYPHEGGVNPQTPDEWMKEVGQEEDARATEEEVRKLLGACASSSSDGLPCSANAVVEGNAELPWTDAEALLASGHAQNGGPSLRSLLVKGLVLGALLALLYLHSDGRLRSSASKSNSKDGIVFAEELEKPSQGIREKRPWKFLLVLVVGGGLLEALGLLDRFSFGCTLAVGLLLNMVLPLLILQTPQDHLKVGKDV